MPDLRKEYAESSNVFLLIFGEKKQIQICIFPTSFQLIGYVFGQLIDDANLFKSSKKLVKAKMYPSTVVMSIFV